MKKYVLVIVLILFTTAYPNESLANKDKDEESIDNPISPERFEDILDAVSKEAKKNAPGIKKLVKEYMKSIRKFGKEMNETFGDIL